MEESQQVNEGQPSYWMSVLIASVIFGILAFAISIVSSYAAINAEPTGSYFSPYQLLWLVSCLLGAFGGMLATWHYAREYEVPIKLGKGALIGFLTGVGIVLVSLILNHLWQLVDPDMTQRMMDSMMANIRAMDIPDNQKQKAIDSMAANMKSQQNVTRQLLVGIPLFGILNLVTGMIGAKIFGKKEEVI